MITQRPHRHSGDHPTLPAAAVPEPGAATAVRRHTWESDMDAKRRDDPFFVPVHPSQHGTLALLTGHLPSGQRIGLAFTSESSLLSVLGPWQQWVRLCEPALRDMLMPLGIDHLRIDPRPVRAAASSTPDSTGWDGAKRERRQATCTARHSGPRHRPQEHRPREHRPREHRPAA